MTAAAPASAPAPGRMLALDGLRALAVLAVFGYHAQLLDGGFFGVDLFFVLSGFLITDLMLREHRRTRRIDLVGFWLRRGFRLLPALLAFLLAGILVAAKTKPWVLPNLLENEAGSVVGLFNWYPVFGVSQSTSWDGHLWSLSVEAQFYLVWPVLLFAALSSRRLSRSLLAGVVGLIVAVAVWRAAVSFGPASALDHWYNGTDTRADSLLVGALLALAWHRGVLHADSAAARRWWTLGSLGAVAVLAAAMVTSPTLEQTPLWAARGGFTLVAALAAVVVGAAAFVPGSPMSRVLSVRPLVYLGGISYAFYLWHFPILFGLLAALGSRAPRPAVLAAALLITLVLAQLSMWLVERPVARLRPAVERSMPVETVRRLVQDAGPAPTSAVRDA